MTTITLDEITRNAVLAALDERVARLEKEAEKHSLLIASFPYRIWPQDYSEDFQRAVLWNIAALHETNMARLQIGEAEPWSESEMRMAAGDR